MGYLFTSESVSEGHPDKVADQISDAILDELLKQDPESKVACETMVTTGLTICSGEIKTNGFVDVQKIARDVIKRIGYDNAEYQFDYKSCGVISTLHEQSSDINQGVMREKDEDQGAGDQGMMFGYATTEMDNLMPMSIELAHIFLQELADIRREKKVMTYLRPDAKSQITIEHDDNGSPVRIDTIVISTQHDDFAEEKEMLDTIKKDVQEILIPRVVATLPERIQNLFNEYTLHVNPTGKFVIGGPHGDTGLTGRKIIVDTYGGHGAHGGGAFSGKDASKVDRSAAYAARHIAKNLVAAGIADRVLIQVAYAIGVAKPVGIFVDTHNTVKVKDDSGNILSDGEIAKKVEAIFDMRPFAIIKRFGLKNPIFEKTASYGHFGRDAYIEKIGFHEKGNGNDLHYRDVEFFAWEKLDYVDKVKKEFGI